MNLAAEGILYSIQIVVAFAFAGPKMAQAERQKTLSRNPAWVLSNPDFLNRHATVAVWPQWAAGSLSLALLGAALLKGDPVFLYAVHMPFFVLLLAGLIFYYGKAEAKVQSLIPKDTVQRAPLIPRSAFRFLSPWSVVPLIGLFLFALALNGAGYFRQSIAWERALGNICFLVPLAGGAWFGLNQTVKRQPYRTTSETDTLGRRFDLQIILTAAYFFALVGLYYTFGSLGRAPVLSMPPTLLHAYIEGQSFPWPRFFSDFRYRIVDYSATLYLIAALLWTGTSRFYRKVLAVQFGKSGQMP